MNGDEGQITETTRVECETISKDPEQFRYHVLVHLMAHDQRLREGQKRFDSQKGRIEKVEKKVRRIVLSCVGIAGLVVGSLLGLKEVIIRISERILP
jgi:hypothetical protein